jgi:hypothetical protein
LAVTACSGAVPPAAAPSDVGSDPPPQSSSAPAADADLGPAPGPTTNEVVLGRFRRALSTVPKDALPGRLVVVDIAYPSSQTEAEAMGGFTLMLLSATAHDYNEFPFKRVYVRTASQTHDLQAVKTRRTVLPANETEVAKVFGEHRFDALYLLPVKFAQRQGDVIVDFATRRSNFRVWSFPAPNASRALPPGLDLEAQPQSPNEGVVTSMAQREFPVFSELP